MRADCHTERLVTRKLFTVSLKCAFDVIVTILVSLNGLCLFVHFAEEYFPCKDLGTELKPIIERFQSKELELRQSSIVPLAEPPIVADPAPESYGDPIAFEPWIAARIAQGPGAHAMFQGREKAVHLIVGSADNLFSVPSAAGSVLEKAAGQAEGLLWQCAGNATIRTSMRQVELSQGDMLLVTAEEQLACLAQGDSSATLAIQNRAQLKQV